ncbi:MAG: choline/carnitine O-acyltransferase [Candidatus Tectomicrobia bacterium]|nr:choline/carnitine O-acyltransferase [Candidatus Tectomicrobia bacterium]
MRADHTTFGNQKYLPSLPVPELDATCTKLLEWVRPLVDPDVWHRTHGAVEDFRRRGGDGETLQARLLGWARQQDLPNWLEPFWDEHYLKSRVPLPINVNFSTVCDHTPTPSDLDRLRRAALLIRLTLDFKSLLDREALSVDQSQGQPLCMMQFKRLFSAARIPQRGIDVIRSPVSDFHPTSPFEQHIVVLHHGHIFSMTVVDGQGKVRTPAELEQDLHAIVAASREHAGPEESVGMLTTLNRDEWAEARALLRDWHPANQIGLDVIERSLFALCLDASSPESLEERFRSALHGDGKNRWFDKSVQLIIGKNADVAVNSEHAGLDGYPVHRLMKYLHQESGKSDIQGQNEAPPTSTKAPEKLHFHLSGNLRHMIRDASEKFAMLIDDTKVIVIEFSHFGKDRIKTFNVSPDAFVQLALQVAQYRLFGTFNSTYEVTATRRFLHGRTETLRSVSHEAADFVKKLTAADATVESKVAALKTAAQTHVTRRQECMAGMGVERHLFGLLNMYDRFGAELGISQLPAIFNDPSWLILRHDTLSTASSPDPTGVVLAGFGPVVEDGFGVCYTIIEDRMTITLTSKTLMAKPLETFASKLSAALLDMAALMQQYASLSR